MRSTVSNFHEHRTELPEEPTTGLQRRLRIWPRLWLALAGVATLGWLTAIGLGNRRARSMASELIESQNVGLPALLRKGSCPKGRG